MCNVELEAVRLVVPFDVLDLATVDPFRSWIAARVVARDADVVLDLSEVELLMAAGVHELLALETELAAHGRALSVANARPIVCRVLRICEVDGWLVP